MLRTLLISFGCAAALCAAAGAQTPPDLSARPAFDPIEEHLRAAELTSRLDALDRAATTADQARRAGGFIATPPQPRIINEDPASLAPPHLTRLGPVPPIPAPDDPSETARRCLAAWSAPRPDASVADLARAQRCREIWDRLDALR